MFIVAQIFGFIAYVFIFLSYQREQKKDFLKTQIFSNLFFIAQYILLGAWSAFTSSSLSICRTLCYYECDKKEKKPSVWMLVVFVIATILFGMATYCELYSIIPIIICCLYAYSTWQGNLKVTYSIGIFAAALWICYNYYVGAYVAVAGSIMELVASIIGLTKLTKTSKESRALVV